MPEPPETERGPTTAPSAAADDARPLAILVVDDDEVDRQAVRRALRAAGLRVELREAADVDEALALLDAERFDCVFLDYQLPGGDGMRVLREARRRGVDAPIVMLTGQENTETAVELMKAGAADYLSKNGLTGERLARSIHTVVRLHTAERSVRRTEDALRHSEQRYRSLVEATVAAVWIVDSQGAPVDESLSWRALTGQSKADVREGWLEVIHPDDREHTALRWQTALASGVPYETEHRLRCADGSYRHMLARAVPVRGDDGRIREWMGTHTDITRRKQAEHERSRAMEVRSRFFTAMSHELRTPINAIIGYNELLLDGIYGELTEQQLRGIDRSQRAARHLLDLVNDVLDLSKLEAGKMDLLIEETSVPELIHDLFVTVRPLAEQRNVELQLKIDECVPIRTDPRRVRQILLNLLSNAIKFGAGKPVETRCSNDPDDGVVIEVADHGEGIAAVDMERIFEEFVQLPNVEQGGTGLGLPISQRLALLLGGGLEVESVVGRGSRFRLRLPREVPEEAG